MEMYNKKFHSSFGFKNNNNIQLAMFFGGSYRNV